jgi:hypothetical protein
MRCRSAACRLLCERTFLALVAPLALLAPLAVAPTVFAAPQIASIAPRGLAIGQPTTVVITGSDLAAQPRLLLPEGIAQQTVKGEAKADRIEIEVTLAESASPGLVPLRVATATGISPAVIVGVDRLPQHSFAGEITALPVALSGTVGGGQVLKATLAGKAGQRLVLDVEAQRLGAGLTPVVRLYNPRGRQIAWSPPLVELGGDARCEITLPEDATYTIELHDQLYRPAGPGYFRLKIGDLATADFALPLAVAAGSKQALAFPGSSVGGSPMAASAEQDATAASVPGETSAALPAAQHLTGAAPRLAISTHPELVEAAPAEGAAAPQELSAAPVGISGVLSVPGQEDKYVLPVTAGQKLRVAVVARQFGSPLDAELSIRKPDGGQLAYGDDSPGSSDPAIDFDVPAGVAQVHLVIKDRIGGGGANCVYRIEAVDRTLPDFGLTLPSGELNLPAGGTQVVPVQIARRGYGGPIELSIEGLPSGVTLAGNVIPAGATIGLLTLSAAEQPPQAAIVRVIGRALESPQPLARVAAFGEVAGSKYRPSWRTLWGLAVTERAPIGIVWNGAEGDKLLLGSKLAARLALTRTEGTAGNIRIRLLTSQPMPRKTIKENNQDKEVDDLDRALRLEGEPTFAADAADPTVQILVPADLAQQPWDVVLVADLLAADGRTTVASLAAPVRRLSTAAPIELQLTGEPQATGKAGAGETDSLRGTIVRAAGFDQPVAVTLEGLPKGLSAPQAIVPAGQSDFELPLTFAFGAKAGPLKGAKLVALSAPVSTRSVKSNAIPLAIEVVPGEKPTAEPPLTIFEDDESFIGLLTEGSGRAIPEQRDKYSGKYCLRVTPDQRLNPALPMLGVKIRENPGPGEYRYIRFAWKKAGGNSICLQLNHDGAWGPGGEGGREGAKFRYHAGPGGECYGASLVISDKLPGKFALVTRDLFADFGEFTLNGLAFSPVDGNAALFDHLYLARQMEDFEMIKVEK